MDLMKPIIDHFKTYSKLDIILSIISVVALIMFVIALYTITH